jgi:polyphosphate glucokinase
MAPTKTPRSSKAGPSPRESAASPAKPAATATEPEATLTVHEAPYTLCVDVGGTGLKAIVLDSKGAPVTERLRIDTPRPATPDTLVRGIAQLIAPLPASYDRVSVGFPGVVQDHVVRTAPNLDGDWAGIRLGHELEKLTARPVRVLNDAGVQGFGVIEGKGVEMVLTFGTGMGTALYLDGHYVPNLELAHHPLRKGKTYEETVDNATLEKIGKKRWRGRVHAIVDQVLPIWNPRKLYLGGGNARLLKKEKFPDNVVITENIAGLLGGIALWNLD